MISHHIGVGFLFLHSKYEPTNKVSCSNSIRIRISSKVPGPNNRQISAIVYNRFSADEIGLTG